MEVKEDDLPPPPPDEEFKQLTKGQGQIKEQSTKSSFRKAAVNNANQLFSDLSQAKGKSENELLEAAMKLQELSSNKQAAKRMNKNKEAARTLIQAIKEKPRFAKLVEYSIDCMSNLCIDGDSCVDLIEEGVVHVLKDVMVTNPFNEKLQRAVGRCVEKMVTTPEFTEEVSNAGVVDLMLSSLTKHHEELTHEQNQITLVKMFKGSPAAMINFAERGGVQAIAKIIQDNTENEKIQASMGVLVAELSKDPKVAVQFHQVGLLDSMLQALVTFPENAEVVKSVVQHFNVLIKADRRYLEEIRKKGGIDGAISAMELNPDDESLLELGTVLMNNMSAEVELAHSIKAVAGADFTSSAAVAKIGNLALVGENVEIIMNNGGTQALTTAVKIAMEIPDQEESKKIVESAMRAFGRLCTNPKHVQTIVDQEGLSCIMGVLTQFSDNSAITAEAITTLTRIAAEKAHADIVVAKGGMKVLKSSLQNFGGDQRIVNAAVECLSMNTKVNRAVATQFVKDEGLPVLIGSLDQFSDNPNVLLNILNNLMDLLQTTPLAVKEFAGAGGLDTLVHLLYAQIDNPQIMQAILTMFDFLACDEKLSQQIGETDTISDSIFVAVEKHSANSDIQDIGAHLIGKMTCADEFGAMVSKITEWPAQLLNGSIQYNQAIGQKLIKHLQKISDLSQIPEQAKLLAEKGAVDAVLVSFNTAVQLNSSELRDGVISAAASATVRFLAEDLIEPSKVSYEMFEAILDRAVASTENEALALKAVLLAQELSQEEKPATAMLKDGSIKNLVTLSSNFPFNDEISGAVVVAVGRLAMADSSAVKQIVESGGHELLVMSAHTNMDNNVDNVLNALNVMDTLSGDDHATNLILEAGAVEVLIKSLKAYPDNVDVQVKALELLDAMAINEEIIQQITDAELLPMFIKSMGDYKEIEDIQKANLNLLSKLSKHHDFVVQMITNDLQNVVLAIADANPENSVIQEHAANLVTVIANNLEDTAIEEEAFDEVKVEEGIENIKSVTANIVNMEVAQTINVIDQLKSLSSSKGAVWKLAHEGGFGTLMNILSNNTSECSVIHACVDALDEMLETMGEDVSHVENVEDVIGSVTQTMVALDKMSDIDSGKTRALLKHLCNLSKVKENRRALMKKGALDTLLHMFATLEDNVDILTDLCKLLGVYGAEEEMWKKILRDNTIEALIRAMRKFLEVEKFEQYAEFLLGTLALYEPLKHEIARCNGIEVTGDIMGRWEKSVDVISNCNYCLANCSFNNDVVVTRIFGSMALQQLINSLANHADAPDLLQSAATTISNLCYEGDASKEHIARLGAAKGLVEVVLRNYNRPTLLVAAFRAIGNLAYYLDNVPIIIREGAVQGIVAGMTVHVDELEVIKVALGVMTNLAADAKEENQAIMAQEGAVQAICEVAKAHADKAEVEMLAMSSLVNLVQEEYNAAMVVRQGGLLGVVNAMQLLNHDIELMQTAMRLICEVSKNEKMATKIIKTPNIIETMCKLMEQYPNDPSVLSDGLCAFFHLASNKDTAEKLGKRGVLPVTMKIVETKMSNLPHLKEAMRALGSLAKSENLAYQMASDSMSLSITALQLYYKDNILCELVLSFVGNVCCFDRSADKVGTTDVIPVIISTTKSKQEQRVVVLRGLRALENIAYSSDINKAKLKKEGALLAMETFRKFWMKDKEVEQACLAAMDAILGRRKRDQNTDVFSNVRARLKDAAKFDGKDLPQSMKNMLIAGMLMTKHSNYALPHPKHVFVTRDLKKLCWRDPKKPNEDAKFLKISAIKVIKKGACTPQLRRRNAFGQHFAMEERSFACLCKERNLSLECGTEQERDEWVGALNALKLYQKVQKQGEYKPE